MHTIHKQILYINIASPSKNILNVNVIDEKDDQDRNG